MLNEYNPQALEEFIDASRSLCDWTSVISGIERYAHLFDVGAASYTRQHTEIHEIRSYYWICMAQVVLYTRKDYNNAIDCSRRAIDINRSNIDAVVVLSQILLTVASKFLINNNTNNSDIIDINEDNDETYVKNIEYKSIILLQDILVDLPKSEQTLLMKILDAGSFTVKNCTLAILNTFNLKDLKLACNDVLYAIRQPSRSRPSLTQLLRIWILSICKNLLGKISLNTVLMRYISDNMSDYGLCFLLDGVLTKIHILEILNDLHQARAEIIILLNEMISPFHSSFMKLPKRCKNMITMEAFRLPFLEMKIGLYDEAIESFKECTLESGLYSSFAPIPIRIAHAVFAAISLLKRSKKSIGNINDYIGDVSNIRNTDVDDALSLLLSAYKLLSTKVDLSHNSILPIQDFYPSLSSLKVLLPSNSFDIDTITNIAVWSRVIGTLIISIMDTFNDLSVNIEDKNGGLEILEHCLTLDLQPNSDYLWYIANKYKVQKKIKYACEFLIQAHDAVVEEKVFLDMKENKNINLTPDFQEILKWLLHDKLLPSLHPWVPIVSLVDTLLNDAHDAEKALEFAHKGLSLFSDQLGEEILNYIESDQTDKSILQILDGIGNQFSVSEILTMNNLSIDQIIIDLSRHNHISSLDDKDRLGLYELVYLFGSCHKYFSEKRNLKYSDKFKHSCIALKSFMLLHNSSSLNINSKIFSKSKISLNYAVCLANVGEGCRALEIIDTALLNNHDDTASILLHLQAILLCSGNNISQLSRAHGACERAILISNSLNAKLTLAVIELAMGNISKALENVEIVVEAATTPSRQVFQLLQNEKTLNITRTGSHAAISDISLDNTPNKFMLIDIFLTASCIFRKCHKIVRAKMCLEEAWQLLYLAENIETIVDSTSLKNPGGSTYHHRIDTIRKIPTLMGWKMLSGSGWGAVVDKYVEADILNEAGNILLSESSEVSQINASELYSFALSICPDHVPTLLALSDIELNNAVKNAIDNEYNNYTNSYSLAIKAINACPVSSKSWYVLGKVLEEMNMKKEAAQVYISVINCTKYSNLRHLSTVNYDKF